MVILPALFTFNSCRKSQEEENQIMDLTQFVDPLIGTGGHGHTFPGASLPFGMVQLSPDNGRSGWDWCSGYNYSSDSICGFSHTHLSGTGIGDMLDISIMPTSLRVPITYNDSLDFNIRPYFATFSHQDETAEPGYYRVRLKESGILAEFTASYRSGFHRYTFPAKTDTASLIVNLGFHENWDAPVDTHIKVISDTLLTGFRYSKGWAANQKVYFAMRLSQPIIGFYGSGQDTLYVFGSEAIQAPSCIAVLKFKVVQNPVLMAKMALSSVSEENALINLNEELPDWDFDKVKNTAKTIWNQELAKAVVSGATPSQMKVFYTALYHSMLAPNIYSDVNFQFRGPDDVVHSDSGVTNYYTFSLWDTYRAEHPLFTILEPDKDRQFVLALLAHYRYSGQLPVWTLWGNETHTMIGYHSIPVITDAFFKGLLTGVRPDTLFKAMLASAKPAGGEVPVYAGLGYLPADTLSGSVSKTLEYAFDDWCIARMADSLRNKTEFDEFTRRSGNFKNLWDPSTRFMRPKMARGNWKLPFDPFYAGSNNDYVEGNAWEYAWYVPQDIGGLIRLMGGENAFARKLDSLFSVTQTGNQQRVSDVSGLIGQYAQGNEPSHHIPYLYNYCGQPAKTRQRVRQILNTFYTDKPDGLCGNEDCGQMSAWYLFSSMGFYPVNPASGIYDLGGPMFSRVDLHLDNGKVFTIMANKLNEKNIYVSGIKLNGEPYNRLVISHSTIMAGGTLEFEMTSLPN